MSALEGVAALYSGNSSERELLRNTLICMMSDLSFAVGYMEVAGATAVPRLRATVERAQDVLRDTERPKNRRTRDDKGMGW